jgi:hypothetical protein
LEWTLKKTNDARESQERAYQATVSDVVPFFKEWYSNLESQGEYLLPLPESNAGAGKESSECLERLAEDIKNTVPVTSPAMVERVLQNMGLANQRFVRSHLDDLLAEPQTLESIYDATFQCAALSPGMMRFACTAEATSPWNLADSDQRTYLVETVHSAIVLEALTRFLVDDVAALQEIADLMQSTQLRAMYEFAGETYSTNKAAAFFALAKYRSTAGAMKHLAESLATNTPSSSFTSRLQVNLLEAAHVDVTRGNVANARVAVALAAATKIPPVFEDHSMAWRLGTDWTESYVTWLMASTLASSPTGHLRSMLIPSIMCTVRSSHGENFMMRQTISLALSTMMLDRALLEEDQKKDGDIATNGIHEYYYQRGVNTRSPLASAVGESNLKTAILPTPSSDAVGVVLSNLCAGICPEDSWGATDTVPLANLDDTEFRVYVGFIIWINALVAGFGLELMLWLLYFNEDGWSKRHSAAWTLGK